MENNINQNKLSSRKQIHQRHYRGQEEQGMGQGGDNQGHLEPDRHGGQQG